VSVSGPWMWDTGSESVFSTRTDTRDLDPYRVVASRVLPDPALLDGPPGTAPADVAPYDQPVEVTAPVQALTERIIAGETSDYGKAAALQAFFRDDEEGFTYSESVPTDGSPDALQDFLYQRAGFCQQYATAMAAMLRVAGVPSRVAVGFTSGTRTVDGSYLVTTEQAHAWPEAWFDGVGWLRFEPTPSVAGIRPPAYETAAEGGTGSDVDTPEATTAPGEEATGPESDQERKERQEAAAAARAGLARDTGAAPVAEPVQAESEVPVRGLLVGAGLLLLLALPALVHALRRRSRWRAPDAGVAWAQLRDDAVDVGHGWSDAESPRQAAARLAAQRHLEPGAREALDRLARDVERARYARPGSTGTSGSLSADSAHVRSGLRSSARPARRLRAVLLPASTVRWLASGAGSACADVLDALDRGLAAVGRRVRRRPA